MPSIKGFEQHGFRAKASAENETQYVGKCPFCMGQKDRFYINKEVFLWDCKLCGYFGNFNDFLEKTVNYNIESIASKQMIALSKDKGLKPQTLRAWGVGWNGHTYTIGAKGNPSSKVTDIRRYKLGGKIQATAGAKLSLICPQKLGNTPTLWLIEGEWDGMAFYECLRKLNIKDDIYAVPGAGVLPKNLLAVFEGKDVIAIYDNDDAGRRGLERLSNMLKGIARSIQFLWWPSTYDDEYDLRDLYLKNNKNADKVFKLVKEMLRDRVETPSDLSAASKPLGDGLLPNEVRKVFKKWLYMESYEPLDVAYGAMFANRLSGDPIWLFMVAPPGGTKTEILMSFHQAPLVYTTTSLTPHALISGANFGGRDPSLIPKLDGHVMIVKDFTTILSMHSVARDEIFGTLRDAYDGQIQKQFGNGVVRAYESKFGIVAGVTPVIESLHAVNISLGERFLKYRINYKHKRNAVKKALQNVKLGDEMRTDLTEISRACLDYEVQEVPDLDDQTMHNIMLLAEWVALLRGVVDREQYTGNVKYKPMTELGTRLAKQLSKLAFGISIFKRESVISKATYNTIIKVACDTVPDRVEEVVRTLYKHDCRGKTEEIATWTKLPASTIRALLDDLHLLEIVKKDGHYFTITNKVQALMLELELYQPKKIKRRNK